LNRRAVSEPTLDIGEVFDQDYLYFYEPQLTETSDAQVEVIWRVLELEPAMEVLDLACGHGRIANRLAQRGARVTGLDATPLLIRSNHRPLNHYPRPRSQRAQASDLTIPGALIRRRPRLNLGSEER